MDRPSDVAGLDGGRLAHLELTQNFSTSLAVVGGTAARKPGGVAAPLIGARSYERDPTPRVAASAEEPTRQSL